MYVIWNIFPLRRVNQAPRKLFRSAKNRPETGGKRKLYLEQLEVREVPTAYTWVPTAAGAFDWNNPANWSPNTGFPNAVGDVANLNNAIVGSETINLNQAITVGTLNLGASSGTSTFTVAGNGGSLTLNDPTAAAINKTTGGADVISANIALGTAATVNTTVAMTISGMISGSVALTKAGAANLTLSGANTFTGGVNQNAGEITIGNATGLGTGKLTVATTAPFNTTTGGTSSPSPFLYININSPTITVANAIALPAPTAADYFTIQSLGGNGSAVTLSGVISGGGTNLGLELFNTVAGDVTSTYQFTGTNTFAAMKDVILYRSSFIVTSATSIGSSSNPFLLRATVNSTLGDLRFAASGITFPNPIQTISGDGNDTVDPSGFNDTLSGVISNTGPFTEVGTGSLTLTATSTYTGATVISGGTLYLNGTLSATTSVAVASGATLAGTNGTINSAATTTVTGTLSPGNGTNPGVLNLGSLAFGSGGVYNLTLNGVAAVAPTTYDQVTVAGTVNLANGSLGLASQNLANINASVPLLIIKNNGTSAVTNPFLNQPEGSTITLGGINYTVSYVGGDGNDVTLTRQASTTYTVDTSYDSSTPGWGVTAFATIGSAIAAAPAAPDTVISVDPGTYNEAVVINEQLTLEFTGAVNINSLADTVTNAAVVLNAGSMLTTGSDNTSTSFSSVIAGAGQLVKTGTGVFTLNNASNSYTGGTVVSGGDLLLGAAGALPSNNTFATDYSVTVNAPGTLTLNGKTESLVGLSGDGTVEDASSTNITLTVGTFNGTSTFGGVLQNGTGTGKLSLLKTGTGTFTLSGTASTYTGVTTVSAGTLAVMALALGGQPSSIGASTSADTNLLIQNGADFQYAAVGSTATTDRSFLVNNSGGAIFEVTDPGSTVNDSGSVYSAGFAFAKNGAGTLNFSTNDALDTNFTAGAAGITVNGGTLGVANIKLTRSSSSSHLMTLNAGTFLNSSGTIETIATTTAQFSAISGAGTINLVSTTDNATNPDIYFNVGSVVNSNADDGDNISAAINLGSSPRYVEGLTEHNSVPSYGQYADSAFTGVISGSAGASLILLGEDNYNPSSGSNWMEMPFYLDNGANTFTGPIQIQRGSLYFSATGSLPGNNLTLSPASGNNARFYLDGISANIGDLNSSGAGTSLIANSPGYTSVNPATLTITSTTADTFAGSIVQTQTDGVTTASGTSGAISLVLNGTGSLTLSGTTSITGTVNVNGSSTLNASGSFTASGTGNDNIASGATLISGSGAAMTLGGAVVVNGTLVPGGYDVGGSITTAGLSFGTGGILSVDLLGNSPGVATGYDQIISTGPVDLTNAVLNLANVNVNNVNPGISLSIIHGNSPINGNFASVTGTNVSYTSLTEGSTITVGTGSSAVNFTISYVGGIVGYDVTLTRQSGSTYTVDTTFNSSTPGYGVTTFSTMGSCLAVVPAFSNIVVDAGTYNEDVVVNQPETVQIQVGSTSFNSLADTVSNNVVDLLGNLTVGADNMTTTFSSSIIGPGSLTQTGTGVFTLGGANSFSGGLTVSAGAIDSGSTSAGGTGSLTVASGADFQLDGYSQTFTQVSNSGTIENNSTTPATLSFPNSGPNTFTGVFNNGAAGGALSLNISGSGTLIFAGASNYSGSTTDNGVALQAGSTTALGVNSTTTLNNGASLALEGFNLSLGSIAGSGNVSNGGTTNAVLTVGGDGTSTTSAGLFSDGGTGTLALLKTGAGTFQMNGVTSATPNTYSGGTIVSQGTLETGNPNGWGTGSITLADANSGSIPIGLLLTNNVNLSNPITVTNNGTGTVTIGTFYTNGQNVSYFNSNITLGRSVTFQGGNTLITGFTGFITGPGGITTTTVNGSSRVSLVRSSTAYPVNNYAGSLTIGAGSPVEVEIATADGNTAIPDGATVNFANATSTLEFAPTGADTETVNALVSQVAGAGVIQPFYGANTATFNLVIGAGDASGNYSGTIIANAGSGIDLLSLTKTGTGTQTLTGVNTYTAGTTVQGGTLLVNNTSGSGLGTGPVTVGALGLLGGTGIFTGAVSVSGVLAPGGVGATSVFKTGALTFGAGGVFDVDINGTTAGTGYDQLQVTGTANLNNGNLVVNAGSGLTQGSTFTILTSTGALSGAFANGATIVAANNPQDIFTVSIMANSVVLTLASVTNGTSPTLDVTAGGVTFSALGGANDGLTVSNTAGAYTVADSAGAITLTSNAISAGWSVNGDGSVTGPTAGVTSFLLNLGDGTDQITSLDAGSANVTVDGTGSLAIAGATTTTGNFTILGFATLAVQNTLSATTITTNLPGTITATAGSQLAGTTLNLGAEGGIGTPANNVLTAGTTIATATVGPVYLTEAAGGTITSSTYGLNDIVLTNLTGSLTVTATTTDGNIIVNNQGSDLTLTAAAGGFGNVTASTAAGTLTIAGATTALFGNIALSSGGAVAVNANVGSSTDEGTIAISANTLGSGSGGYTQATTATLRTTNTSATGIVINVNTAMGGSGDAVLGGAIVGTATAGTYTVNANGGSIIDNTAFTFPNHTAAASPTWAITAFNTVFNTSGAGSIGASQLQPLIVNTTNNASAGSFVAGSGGIYVLSFGNGITFASGTGYFQVVTQAIAAGAGNIWIQTTNEGNHGLIINGPVWTQSGNIQLDSDDNLVMNGSAVIGGTMNTQQFSGNVLIHANMDLAGGQYLQMNSGSSITTTSTAANAVVVHAYPTTTGGGIQAGNITVGNGGGIQLYAAFDASQEPVQNPPVTDVTNPTNPARSGSITQMSGTILDAGATGTITLEAASLGVATEGNIGSTGSIQTNAGTVNAISTNEASATGGTISVTNQGPATFTASTTAVSGTSIGGISLSTVTGLLTVAGVNVASGGSIILIGAGGVTIAAGATLGNSLTAGINIYASGNNATLNTTLTLYDNESLYVAGNPGLLIGATGVLAGTGATYNSYPVTTQTGGVISPGSTDSPTGILTTGTVDMSAGGTFFADLTSTGSNELNVNGTINLMGAPTLTGTLGTGFNAPVGTVFTIMNASSPISGTFAGLPEGSVAVIGGLPFTVSYLANGGDSVTLTLTNNVNTATAVVASPNPVLAGQTETLTATVSLPTGTGVGFPGGTVNFYDGTTLLNTTPATLDANGMATFTTTTLTPGTHSITAMYEGDGSSPADFNTSTSTAVTLTVNQAPAVTMQPTDQTVNSGSSATFTAVASGFPIPMAQWFVSTNGGTSYTPVSGATSATLTLSNVTTDMSGNLYEVTFTNTVGSATSNAALLTVNSSTIMTTTTLTDLGPSPSLNFGGTIQPVAFLVHVTPASGSVAGDTVSLSDNNVAITGATGTLDANGNATITVANFAVGAHPITATFATQGNFAPSTSPQVSQSVVSTFQVDSATLSGNAIRLVFDGPIDPTTTQLYYSPGTTAVAPDVTVTGPSGNIKGSLVIDATNPNVATFVATAGQFAAGSYTVAVTTAVKAVGGATLTANYSQALTAAPVTPLVTAANVARGPGETVNVPNNSTGLPISVSGITTAVASASFTLTYDPTLLSVTAAALSTDAATNGNLVLNPITFTSIDAHHMQITFTIVGGTGGGHWNPTGGTGTLLTLTATVPQNAPYTDKALLATQNVVINTAAAQGDAAVDVNAYPGDVHADGHYTGLDATLISRVAVGAGTGFSPFKDLDPFLIGGVSGSSTLAVTGLDATDVSRAVVGSFPSAIPQPPSGITIMGPTGPDPRLYLAAASGSAGQTVTVQERLNVTASSGVEVDAIDSVIEFDPSKFTVANLRAGSLLPGYLVVSNIDAVHGIIRVTEFTASPVQAAFGTDGAVLLIDFTVNARAPAGPSPLKLAANNGATTTGAYNADGPLTLSPAPHNPSTLPISNGTVSSFVAGVDNYFTVVGPSSAAKNLPTPPAVPAGKSPVTLSPVFVSGVSSAVQPIQPPANALPAANPGVPTGTVGTLTLPGATGLPVTDNPTGLVALDEFWRRYGDQGALGLGDDVASAESYAPADLEPLRFADQVWALAKEELGAT